MTERFEKAIQDWYDNSRTANLEYLDLSQKPKVKVSDLENNISVIYDKLLLSSKISIKNFHELKNQQKQLSEKLNSCEDLIRKTQSEVRKSFQHISSEIQESKPLTRKEVLDLVQEIAQQPKLVEEEALKLTSSLDKKVQQVEVQIQKVEHLLHDIK